MSNKDGRKKKPVGRPKSTQVNVAVPLRLNEAIVEALDRFRNTRFRSRTDVIREALIEYLTRHGFPPELVVDEQLDLTGVTPEQLEAETAPGTDTRKHFDSVEDEMHGDDHVKS